VRHYDLRQPHRCTPDHCSAILLDYSAYDIELNGLSRSVLYPHYIATCGRSFYAYLHDRRMIRDTASSCLKRYAPKGEYDESGHATAVRFGKYSGREVS
jgi:hypothetical protein